MSGILRWPAICGNGDGGIFWDPQVTLNTSSPDLTLCFQATVISWVPLALLWITLPLYLPFLLVKPTINTWRNKSKLNITKLFLSVLLLIVSLIDLSHGISKGSNTDLALIYYISPAIMALSMILTLYLIHLEYQKGVYTSGVFFIVWLLMVLLDIVPFRSNILQLNKGKVDDKLLFVTFYIKYGLVLGQFILALFVDAAVNNVLEIDERTPLLQDNAETLNSGTVTEKCNKPPCPEETSSFFSTLLHWWCTRLLVKGYRKPLTFDDMYDIMDDDRGKSVIKKFNSEWEKQTGGHTSRRSVSDGRQPSFMWTLIRAAWGPFWISFLARLAMCFTEYLGPVLLSVMLEVLSDKNDYMWKGIFMAFIMLLGNTINSLVVNYFFKFGYLFSMRVRTAVTLAVYRKALKLSSTARKTTTVGQIVNLMSVDAQKLHDTFIEMHEVWAGPLQIIIGMSILWNIMGPSSLAGLGVLLILAPINGFYLIRKFTKLQEIQMKQKDERIKMVNEILNGIKKKLY